MNADDYRLVFESAPGSYLILLPDLTVAAASDAYLAFTMTDRQEIMGRGILDVFHPSTDDSRALVANLLISLHSVLQQKTPQTLETYKHRTSQSNGSFEDRYLRLLNKPVLNSRQEVLFIIHSVEDVSASMVTQAEQKTTEIKIKSLTQELEAFTYSVSHDLRAPLRSVVGYSQILKEDYSKALNEEGKGVIEVIARGAQRMSQLIDDLLDFSKVGRMELSPVRLNMDEIVSTVVKEQTSLENDRRMNIRALPLKAPVADSGMMRLVWTNLISNALKYSRKKELTEIEIGCYQNNGADTAAETTYYIYDNGAGFDMTYVDKLFKVFQRLHKVNDFEGTGVGLALVKRILQRHGGNIWAEGKINEGAKFFFTLPQYNG